VFAASAWARAMMTATALDITGGSVVY